MKTSPVPIVVGAREWITMVKDLKDLIAKSLKKLLNYSVANGVFLDIWNLARVAPTFKLGAKIGANNYRPISVTSVFFRMQERLMHDKLFDFFKVNKELTCNQCALKKFAAP